MKPLLLAAVVLLAGCAEQPDSPWQERILVMGTVVELSLYGLDEDQAQQAGRNMAQQLQELHRQLHPWQGDGELHRINQRLTDGRPSAASAEMTQLLQRAQKLAESSDGLFDPAIAPLIRLWGFHQEITPEKPPAAEELVAWREQPASITQLAFAPAPESLCRSGSWPRNDAPASSRAGSAATGECAVTQLRPPTGGLELDLGAFAKGYAVDLAVQTAAQAGANAAIVNAGGDLCTLGRPGDRDWRIGIRHPREAGVLAAARLKAGECIFTSGDYERHFEHAGRRYHHLLDPRSASPARGTQSVTVITEQGALADAAATALFVAGPAQWQTIAERLGIEHVLLIDATGRAHLTAAMAERLSFETEPAAILQAAPP